MDHYEKQEKIRAAQRRLRAQRARAGTLRGRVVVVSAIVFVLLWGVVFTQMATGNDPVLGDSSKTVASAQRTGARAEGGSAVEGGAGTDAEEDRGPIEEVFHAGTEQFRETLGIEGEGNEAEAAEAEAAELEASASEEELLAAEAAEAEAIQAEEEELEALTTSQS